MMKRNLFLFVLWEKARKAETEMRSLIGKNLRIIREVEVFWPGWTYVWRLKDFYGFGSWFTWWNKSRKCGKGPFLVLLVENPDPVWEKRRDTRGRELLVDDHVYQLKKDIRHMTGHSNIVHSSVTLDETLQEVQKIFHCTPEELASAEKIPSAEDLEHMLDANMMTMMGEGMRRICWRIPDSGLCLKTYRRDGEMHTPGGVNRLRKAVVREIRRCRHDEKRNTSCLEWRYHQELRNTTTKELLEVFPERVERIYLPTYGWCLVETIIVSFDGTTARPVADEIRRLSVQWASYADLSKAVALIKALPPFFDMLADATVRFYDPPNVIVQWTGPETFRLRIADFEPKARTVIALDRWFDFCARFKCRRRYRRFLRSLGPEMARLKACEKDIGKV